MRLIIIDIMILVVLINCGTARHNFMMDLDDLMLSKSYDPLKEHWFIQYLDHFNAADDRIWEQRYFMNDDYYKPNGPVFLYVGAESTASSKWVYKGQMVEDAKRYGAMMFLLEHRYYGKSQPTSDLSVQNLTYLNTEQALLDLAYFIEGMKKTYQMPENTKWILFGCSYAGSLAAWMRAKYPHLVHGSMSASGPLLAKIDFQEYLIVVEDSLKTHSQKCIDVISRSVKEMHAMMQNSLGQQKLEKLFNLCDPIDSEKTTAKDIANLYQALTDSIAYVVQYNKNNRHGSKITIDMICDVLVDEGRGVTVNRLAEVINMTMEQNKEKCLDYKYSNMVRELRNTTLTKQSRAGGRQWMYQTCTEFGFYQTSTARPNLFGEHFPVDFFLQLCVDIFGPQFAHLAQLGVERTNIIFGALDLANIVSNVAFVHGSIDPWYALGITKSSNPSAPAIFINGTAHCANIYPASKSDLPQLVEARKEVTQLIGQWLND